MAHANSLSDFTARLRDLFAQPANGRSRAFDDHQFNTLALELFRLQCAGNSALRHWIEHRGIVPGRLEHWTEIPALPTAAFKEWEVTSLPEDQRVRLFVSSGTTLRECSRHYHSKESLGLYEASASSWFREHLLAEGEAGGRLDVLALAPPAEMAPQSSLVHMLDTVVREYRPIHYRFASAISREGTWLLEADRALEFLDQSNRANRPVLVMGTAFMFVHLLDAMAQRGVRLSLPAGSRVMETGGYKGRSRAMEKAELHSLITRLLGVSGSHIVCEYGMAELSSQAYDCVAGVGNGTRIFRFPPWARARVISPETGQQVCDGEEGLIEICDLANVFSCMTVRTEDLGVSRGTGFELLGRAPMAAARGCSLLTV